MLILTIAVSAILFVLFILEAFFFCDKYAGWWFGQWSKDYKNYDLKKFKVIREVTVGIVFILSFLMGFCEFKLYISTSSFTIVRL
ncbi:MAG: hypothetical protein MJY46_04220 [Bacteroidales bacterium]|nr:hypothetical protein [Bacteroidales bacterium]